MINYHGFLVSYSDFNTLKSRIEASIASSTLLITDPLMPAGKYAIKPDPGGVYNEVWLNDASLWFDFYPLLFTADEMQTYVDWWLYHQLDSLTSYTGQSGNIYDYPIGTVPDHISLSGTPYYRLGPPSSQLADRSSYWSHFEVSIAALSFGRKRNFDSTWVNWFSLVKSGKTNIQRLEDAFNAVPYDSINKLIKQWDSVNLNGLAATWPWTDAAMLTGGILGCSIQAYLAANALYMIYEITGLSSIQQALWQQKAIDLRDGIRASFTEPDWNGADNIFEYYHESFSHNDVGVLPDGWTNGASGGSSLVSLHPVDQNLKVIYLNHNSAATYLTADRSFSSATRFAGPFTRFRFRVRVKQTNRRLGVGLIDASGRYGCYFALHEDGHFKYGTVGSFTNLTVDTIYLSDADYNVEFVMNWSSHTYEIIIDGASKGASFPFYDSLANTVQIIEMQAGTDISANLSESFWWDFVLGNDVSPFSFPDQIGWLTLSTGWLGRIPSPDVTAYAAWAGILTDDQTLKASRWLALEYSKPSPPNIANGVDDTFNNSTGNHGSVRQTPHSRDEYHGAQMLKNKFATYTYDNYINGGYWYFGILWIAAVLWNYDPAVAQSFITNTFSDTLADSNENYEYVSTTTRNTRNFNTSSIAMLSNVSYVLPPSIIAAVGGIQKNTVTWSL